MNKKIFTLIIVFIASFLTTAMANEGTFAQVPSGTLIRDPFKTWLPAIEEKKPEPPTEKEATPAETPLSAITSSPIAPPPLQVSGIVWNTKKPQAIVNDTVVTIGDVIGDTRIVDIHKDGVDIIYKEIMFTIPVNQTLTQST